MEEVYRDVVGYENTYAVSDQGNVYATLREVRVGYRGVTRRLPARQLKQRLDDQGHPFVCLTSYIGPARFRSVARYRVCNLVAAAFLGPCPVGQKVHHRDGDIINNNISNLLYSNIEPSKQVRLTGEDHPLSKLTLDDVRWLRKSRLVGTSVNSLARFMNIPRSTCYDVCSGRTWREVGNENKTTV